MSNEEAFYKIKYLTEIDNMFVNKDINEISKEQLLAAYQYCREILFLNQIEVQNECFSK